MPRSLRPVLALLLPALALILPALAPAHPPVEVPLAEVEARLAAAPDDPGLHVRRGELLHRAGRFADAEVELATAARLRPDDPAATLAHAALLLARELPAAAEERLLAVPLDDPEWWRLLARAREDRDPVAAREALERVWPRLHPLRPEDILFRMRLVLAADPAAVDEALAVLDEGRARLGPAAALAIEAAGLEIAAGRNEAAIHRLDTWSTPLPPSPPPHGSGSATPGAAQAVLLRGPYLQVAGDDAVTVRWRTDLAMPSRVGVGTIAGSFPLLVDEGAAVTEHEVRVTGLDPDTRYHYFVGSPTETLAVGPTETFRTHPLPGDEGPRRLWVIGDAGTANANQAAVRDGFLAWNGSAEVHGWLMLGDNAYTTGTDAEYQAAVFDMYPDQLASIPLWATRGNHDDLHAGPGNDYYEIFTFPTAGESGGVASGTEAYYSFDLGNVHFVCLDSDGSPKTPGSAMLTWLAADLAANTQAWTVAFWHHPPYTKGSHDSDDPFDSAGYLVAMRENVLPILEAGGVDLVLGGHSHSYERSYLLDEHYGFSPSLVDSMVLDDRTGDPTVDGAYIKPTVGPAPHEGAVYVVAGSSGQVGGGSYDHPAMVVSLAQLASLALDVEGDRLRGTMVGPSGNEGDTFVILKGVEPTAAPEGPGPAGLAVSPARPNPFTHRTRLAFRVPDRAPVRVTVHDVTGRERARLVDAVLPAGDHEVEFEGHDADGRPLPRGVYFVRFAVGKDVRPMKLVLR